MYSYGTAAWLTAQSALLMVSPTLVVTILSPEVRQASSTFFLPFHNYFRQVSIPAPLKPRNKRLRELSAKALFQNVLVGKNIKIGYTL